jgi:transposase
MCGIFRKRLLSFQARLEPSLVGMEACGSAHYWAREMEKLGHTVKLISPQFVTPLPQGQQEGPQRRRGYLRARL